MKSYYFSLGILTLCMLNATSYAEPYNNSPSSSQPLNQSQPNTSQPPSGNMEGTNAMGNKQTTIVDVNGNLKMVDPNTVNKNTNQMNQNVPPADSGRSVDSSSIVGGKQPGAISPNMPNQQPGSPQGGMNNMQGQQPGNPQGGMNNMQGQQPGNPQGNINNMPSN